VNITPSEALPASVAGEQRRHQALVTRLLHDQRGFRVIAAEIDHVDLVLLHLRDEGGVVLLARRDRLVHRFLHARLVERGLRQVGQSLAVL